MTPDLRDCGQSHSVGWLGLGGGGRGGVVVAGLLDEHGPGTWTSLLYTRRRRRALNNPHLLRLW